MQHCVQLREVGWRHVATLHATLRATYMAWLPSYVNKQNGDQAKTNAIVVLLLVEEEEKLKRVNRQVWVRDWIERRQEKGAFQRIIRDLSVEHTNTFKQFV